MSADGWYKDTAQTTTITEPAKTSTTKYNSGYQKRRIGILTGSTKGEKYLKNLIFLFSI